MPESKGCLGQLLPFLARLVARDQRTETLPYTLKLRILSDNERAFHGALAAAIHQLGQPLIIIPQASLGSILNIPKGTMNWQSWRNRIDRKSIDFLVCDGAFSPLLAIELDDRSHRNRTDRDDFVNEALAAAGLPLLRFPARQAYTPAQLGDQLKALLGPSRSG